MTKFTPGPWDVKTDDFNVVYVANKNQIVADHIIDLSEKQLTQEEINHALADARLISAAPELLEACKYVVAWHREHDSGEGELFGLDFVTTCINAIRKATE